MPVIGSTRSGSKRKSLRYDSLIEQNHKVCESRIFSGSLRQQRLSRQRQRSRQASHTTRILNTISVKMDLKRLVILTVLLCLTFSCYCLAEVFTGNLSSLVGSAKNVSSGFIAPYYHNVSVGNVWVLPSSKYDLGARGMTCECFDPDRKFVH